MKVLGGNPEAGLGAACVVDSLSAHIKMQNDYDDKGLFPKH